MVVVLEISQFSAPPIQVKFKGAQQFDVKLKLSQDSVALGLNSCIIECSLEAFEIRSLVRNSFVSTPQIFACSPNEGKQLLAITFDLLLIWNCQFRAPSCW